jgi:ABC-type antimicrobial peptide transport system permease subunit
LNSILIIIGIVLIVNSIFLLLSAIRAFKTIGQNSYVLEQGQPALFRIVNVTETNIRINYNPLFQFVLQVHPLNGASAYILKIRLVVSILHIPRIQPGSTVPGKYDPENPSMIFLELTRSLSDDENAFAQSFAQKNNSATLPEIEGSSSKKVYIFILSLIGFIFSLIVGVFLLVWGGIHY